MVGKREVRILLKCFLAYDGISVPNILQAMIFQSKAVVTNSSMTASNVSHNLPDEVTRHIFTVVG